MGAPVKWTVAQSAPRQVAELASTLGVSASVARVLCARGFTEPEAARRFLRPSTADLHDPFLLTGMPEATARLARAIEQKEPILLYGDYDVDGTSALVVLKKVLDLAGGIASCYVPHRIRDGYGMKNDAVEDAAARGIRLIVSVDTGIRANQVVQHAAGLGIDVIVTDHHLPEAELPPAVAVLNPNRRDCSYPEKNLCGAGVALKLAEALLVTLGWERGRRERLVDSLLKLVAIATVADVVPLVGENLKYTSEKNWLDSTVKVCCAPSSERRCAGMAGVIIRARRRTVACSLLVIVMHRVYGKSRRGIESTDETDRGRCRGVYQTGDTPIWG